MNSQNFVTRPFSFVLSSILWQCKIWLSGLLQILWNYCKNIRIIADPVSSLPSPCKRALAFTGVDFEFTNTHNIDEDIVFIDTPNPSTFFLFFPGIKISHFWPLSYEWSIQQFLHETWNEIEFGQKCILSIKTFKLKWSMTHRVLLQISPPVVKTDLVGRRDSTIWRCYFYWRLTGIEIFSDLCFFLKILNWFGRLSTCKLKLKCPVFFWVSFIQFFVNIHFLVESVPILLSIFAKQILPNNVMIDFWSWLWFSWLVGKHSWCNGQLVEKISSYLSNFLVFWIYMYLVFLSLSSWLVSKHIWCDERPVVVACKQTVNRLRYCTVLYGFVL